MRAAAISGARPLTAFRRVMLPSILPGVLSGAAFAFVTSFDELGDFAVPGRPATSERCRCRCSSACAST